MPAVFFGHGNPMNAVRDNAWTQSWARLGAALPHKPVAILSISAHWYVPELAVTAQERPRTIHDFGGFPRELFAVEYPAPGSTDLVARVCSLAGRPVRKAVDWGLDHGTWSVLTHVFPDADVPVVQLSIDETQTPASHFAFAKRLAPLRDEGILVMGSGNVVHNLEEAVWGNAGSVFYDWGARFEQTVRDCVSAGRYDALVEYASLGRDAQLSIPTPEHYLPLLYALALQRDDDVVTFPTNGPDLGSISMLSVAIG